ncbi:hypothetical protein NUACC26_008460 [Scytonema sp. NUACC26]
MSLDLGLNKIFQKFDTLSVGNGKNIAFFKNLARSFLRRRCEWCIGIYVCQSLFNFDSPDGINNPVLTAKDITDVPALFVADPFMVCDRNKWYMFFEVLNGRDNKGDIGLATSDDGLKWHYQQIVLDEAFHLSYPYVFKGDDGYYMIPETYEANSVRLYKAVNFPNQWSFVKTLLEGSDYVDSSIFYCNEMWWMFTTSFKGNILRLYYATDLIGNWIEHPKSPVIQENLNIARPGGRVVVNDGKIFRYTQDVEDFYGNQVRVFEITELTHTTYQEVAVTNNPIIKASGRGWNKIGMHNIDPHQTENGQWLACVDGYRIVFVFGFGERYNFIWRY